MTPQQLARRLAVTPYQMNGRSLDGLDCFGLIEVWHLKLFDIEIRDRGNHTSDSGGMSDGFNSRQVWKLIDQPIDHCVVVMKGLLAGKLVRAGHCGIYFNDNVLHTERTGGFQCLPFTDTQIRRKVHALAIHRDLA